MNSTTFHPALTLLLRSNAIARLRRLRRRFMAPRRLVLSALGLLLAVLWLGNAAASILFRESGDPETLRRWLPLGFCVYGLWHVVKVAYRRPEQGIEWSLAEREVFGGAPFARRHLLSYHATRVFAAAIFKAGCFAVLMLPDLKLPAIGFLGALAALLFLELWRMNVEIFAWGISRSAYKRWRAGVLICVAAPSLSAISIAVCSPMSVESSHWPASIDFLRHLGSSASQLQYTPVGQLLCAPFYLFSDVVLADHYSGLLALQIAGCALIIVGLIGLTGRVDRYFHRHVVELEQRAYAKLRTEKRDVQSRTALQGRLQMLPWRHGSLALAWRQFLSVRHYWVSLLIALAPPTALALIPLFVTRDPMMTFVHVAACVAFYSLLLLPAALRFDFRRDIDRMALLKSLPISPRAMVIGQLTAPVVIATIFQLCVLSTAVSIRPIHPGYLAASCLFLVPMNVGVFALDNLIFLLYPYRQNQEGLEIFLRTTLTFTAKGLLFGLVLAITAAWALVAGHIVHRLSLGSDPTNGTRLLFSVGMGIMLISAALLMARLNIRAFSRYDASQDSPA